MPVKSVGGGRFAAAMASLTAMVGSSKQVVRCGFFPEAEYPDGTSVAMVAAIQNYGAPARNIPPRPFFTSMIRANQDRWPDVVVASLRARGFDVRSALVDLGHEMEGELRESIQQTNSPPLRPGTIKRKGSSKPLVDTGRMLNSIVSKVE